MRAKHSGLYWSHPGRCLLLSSSCLQDRLNQHDFSFLPIADPGLVTSLLHLLCCSLVGMEMPLPEVTVEQRQLSTPFFFLGAFLVLFYTTNPVLTPCGWERKTLT